MTEPSDIDAHLDSPDRDLAGRLVAECPVPGADFRGALGRRLRSEDPGFGPRPERLRSLVVLYVSAGMALTGLGALLALAAL